jgi:CheY-like chemotaxis protein
MNILILDDDPNPEDPSKCGENRIAAFRRKFISHSVEWVKTATEAIAMLAEKPDGYWDALFLDHDLGGESYVPSGPGTGYEVACWLEKHPEKKPGQIFLHSLNPVGRDNMKSALPEAQHAPWAWQ